MSPEETYPPYCKCLRLCCRCEKVNASVCSELECHNGGECEWEDLVPAMQPYCTCPQGWTGYVCSLATCSRYCLNGGVCQLQGNRAVCQLVYLLTTWLCSAKCGYHASYWASFSITRLSLPENKAVIIVDVFHLMFRLLSAATHASTSTATVVSCSSLRYRIRT